jgi:hypothetical protein
VPALRRHADPLELALERLLSLPLRLLLVGEALLLLLQPRRVIALPGNAAAAVELEDPAGDVVEEVTIVGDGDDRAGIRLQVVLEPGDRFGVEVVGRLVEQQDVGLLQQQPAESDAAALAAGQVVDGASAGGQPRASIAICRRADKSQAPSASIFSCTVPWRSISFAISSSDIGSAKRSLMRSYSSSSATASAAPWRTMSITVTPASSSGSWARKPIV